MGHTLLYGGTFDPVHHGHLITCLRAREILGAERVVLVPARVSPHKLEATAGATGEERMAMLRAAVDGVAGLEIDGRELLREGPSYTIDTVEQIMREHPNDRLTLLIGADQLAKLHTWHRVGELLAGEVAVLPRSDAGGAGGAGDAEAGLRAVGEHLGEKMLERLRGRMLETPRIDISATEIRERVGRGLAIDYLVPAGVAEFIVRHGLYRK